MFYHPLFIVVCSILFQILIVFIVVKFSTYIRCPHCERKMRYVASLKSSWKVKGKIDCEYCKEVSYVKNNSGVSLLISLPLLENLIYIMLEVPITYWVISFIITLSIIFFAIIPYSYRLTKSKEPLW